MCPFFSWCVGMMMNFHIFRWCLFIIKQEGNSFAFVPKGCSQGVLWTFGIAAKNYGRKMLIKVLSLEL